MRWMKRVNHWRPPRFLRLWMVAATRGGDGWLWYAMALVVALYGGPQRIPALTAVALAVASGTRTTSEVLDQRETAISRFGPTI